MFVLRPVNATEPRDYLNAFLGLSIEAEEGERRNFRKLRVVWGQEWTGDKNPVHSLQMLKRYRASILGTESGCLRERRKNGAHIPTKSQCAKPLCIRRRACVKDEHRRLGQPSR